MEDDNEKFIDTEELKNEATDTVNKVKDSMRDLKIKDESINAKNFVKDMVKDPIGKTEEISQDSENRFLKTSMFMIAVWMIAKLIYGVLTCSKYLSFGKNLLYVVKITLSPLCIIFALTFIIFILNKKNKKSLITVLSTVVTAYIPMCIAAVVHLLNIIDYNMSKITTPVTTLASFITIVLSYFAMKDIFEEETELGAFKKFVLVELIYFGVAIIISFFGISMYI